VNKPELIICRNAEELDRKAAARFVRLVQPAARDSDRLTVALSGGSTPKALYSLLVTAEYRGQVQWSHVHLFWGDERCVPPDHPESNCRMVQESFLSKINIPESNVHRMAGEKEPKTAAAEYEAELRKFFRLSGGVLPRFDLILLGLGEDGHTASLFPGTAVLDDRERLVASVFVEKLGAHRLTLTLPVLNNGADIIFLVAGQSKSAILKEVRGANPVSSTLPAAKIQPVHGQLTWLVTQDAAAGLELQ
jgi:6-phosphogluconolactonase